MNPTSATSELPEFLGVPKHFSQKSWFYGSLSVPSRGPLWGAPLLGPTLGRPRACSAEAGCQASAAGFGWLAGWLSAGLLSFRLAFLRIWLDLPGFRLDFGLWLSCTRIWVGFGLICVDFDWIWVDFGWILDYLELLRIV